MRLLLLWLLFQAVSLPQNNGEYLNRKIKNNSALSGQFFTIVDTMAFSMSLANPEITPYYYHPLYDRMIIVYNGHKGSYEGSAGELWWSYSDDTGETWHRSENPLQSSLVSNPYGIHPSLFTHNSYTDDEYDNLNTSFIWSEVGENNFLSYKKGILLNYGADSLNVSYIFTDSVLRKTSNPMIQVGDKLFWLVKNENNSVSMFSIQRWGGYRISLRRIGHWKNLAEM